MRRYGLGILASVSLLVACFMAAGYVGTYGIVHEFEDARLRAFIMTEGTGGILKGDISFLYDSSSPLPRTYLILEFLSGRSLGSTGIINATPAYWQIFSTSKTTLPNWLILLPCSIAPLMWIRRRRRNGSRGFAVLPSEPAESVGEIPKPANVSAD